LPIVSLVITASAAILEKAAQMANDPDARSIFRWSQQPRLQGYRSLPQIFRCLFDHRPLSPKVSSIFLGLRGDRLGLQSFYSRSGFNDVGVFHWNDAARVDSSCPDQQIYEDGLISLLRLSVLDGIRAFGLQ
jgi:hypothetical protein